MVKTLASIFISLALIVGISAYDIYTVGKTFDTFTAALEALYDKTENKTATYEDGKAIRTSSFIAAYSALPNCNFFPVIGSTAFTIMWL